MRWIKCGSEMQVQKSNATQLIHACSNKDCDNVVKEDSTLLQVGKMALPVAGIALAVFGIDLGIFNSN